MDSKNSLVDRSYGQDDDDEQFQNDTMRDRDPSSNAIDRDDDKENKSMEKNIKFLGCLKIKQFSGLLTFYMALMTLLNIIMYAIFTFFTVLLDPYLD